MQFIRAIPNTLKLMELQFQNTEIPDDVIDCMISMCRTFLRPTVDSKFQLENVDYIEVIYEKLIEMH